MTAKVNNLLEQAVRAHSRGAGQDAERLYTRVLQLDRRNAIAFGNLAILAAQAGEIARAEQLFRAALDSNPRYAQGYNNFGLLLQQQGRIEDAARAFQRAVEIEPNYVTAHLNLGNARKRQRRSQEAIRAYRRVLNLKPGDVAARLNIGVALQESGDLEGAIVAYRELIARAPTYASAHHNLGTALQATGRLADAHEAYRRAVELAPNSPELRMDLALLLRELARPDEAIESLQRAVALGPNCAEAHYNLGILLQEQGRSEGAEASYREAIRVNPSHAEAYNNLGLVLQAQARSNEAAAALDRAIRIRPDYAEAYNNLALIHLQQGRREQAASMLRRALDLNPAYAQAHYNLGNVLREEAELGAAIAAFRRALDCAPDDAAALSQLFFQRCRACDWTHYHADEHRILDIVRGGSGLVPPFVLLATDASSEDQLRCARKWATGFGASDSTVFRHEGRGRDRRLRLGYLSGDFHRHATAELVAELFERHDRERFEVFAYSFGPDDGSAMRARLVRAFDHFVDLRPSAHADSARRIHDDGIDILIDLKGHTLGARPEILALRPAPIQVNYLGFPGTLGAAWIDYIIADPFLIPPDRERFYSEKIAYLPGCYQPNDTKREIATEAPSRAACGLPEEGFVYCCFNNSFKLTPKFFDVWMRLLHRVPGSVLWLLEGNTLMRENLCREAQLRGVDPERLVFAPVVPLPQHLARHANADLFLDTLPCNAHTTASDALWAGLPVLTCAGGTFAGRVAGSLLEAVDLTELITTSVEDYEQVAFDLAGSSGRLAELKAELVRKRDTARLFDIGRLTTDLERAYSYMWNTWRAGRAPETFRIENQP